MSNFLDFGNPSLDIGTTPGSAITAIKGRLTAVGWQIVAENTGADPYIIVKPPASETIGNARGYGVLAIRAGSTNNKIEFHTGLMNAASDKTPQGCYLQAGTYQVTSSPASPEFGLKINGSTFTPAAGATADATLANLYTILTGSADANALLFNYSYITNAGADSILMVAKSPATVATISMPTPAKIGTANGYAIVTTADSCPAGTMPHRSWSLAGALAADYTFGFLYFLGITARSLIFGIKTNSALSGPLFASWADNAIAVANTPPNCTPIELVAGDLSSARTYGGVSCFTSHTWARTSGYRDYNGAVASEAFDRANGTGVPLNFPCEVWSGTLRISDSFFDANASVASTSGGPHSISKSVGECNAAIGGLSVSPSLYNFAALGGPTIASMGLLPYQRAGSFSTEWASFVSGGFDEYNQQVISTRPFIMVPGLPLPDVTAFMAVGSDESLHVAKHPSIATTLVTVMDATTSYPSITLTDASAFPASGAMVIGPGLEIFEWTSKAGNTLAGCTRGLYGSVKAAHAAGETVNLGTWFTKINGGAMPCGLVKPV